MKSAHFLITLLFLLGGSASEAQAQESIDEVLLRVEQASKELAAQRKLTEAQRLEARTGNSLSNPSITYENLWRGPTPGNNSELTVAQQFDFPSVYASRNTLSKLKTSWFESQGSEFRQQLLLRAKELCIEIIYLRQQQMLLDERLSNAEQLAALYKRKLETGAANIIETNKIGIERIAARTAATLNAATLRTQLQQLANLCAEQEVSFSATRYPSIDPLPEYATLEEEYLDRNTELNRLKQEQEVNQQNIAVNRSLGLPKFEVGYRHNYGVEGRFNGILVGMSIPMFENRNKVKAARAQSYFTQTQLQSARFNNTSRLRQLYDQAKTLRESAAAMQQIMETMDNLPLLNKALHAGQITVIDYFTEVNTLFQNREMLLELERDYQLTAAQIFGYQL